MASTTINVLKKPVATLFIGCHGQSVFFSTHCMSFYSSYILILLQNDKGVSFKYNKDLDRRSLKDYCR